MTAPSYATAASGDAWHGALGVLGANSIAYELLVARAAAAVSQGAEATIKGVQAAAGFAGDFHPGRLSDGAIENLALQLGTTLTDTGATPARDGPRGRHDARRRVLHVATRVYRIGGHTRMLQRWIAGDPHSRHCVVLLDQADRPIPQSLHDAILRSNGDLHQLDAQAPLMVRCRALRALARTEADLVVLHHHPFDATPTVAFADPGGPPVALVNHADHLFGLGSTVSDLTIDLRAVATPISSTRRFARRGTVLPIPLPEHSAIPSRSMARQSLGIPADQVVLLSVGRPEKYRACGAFSFPSTAGRLLDARPSTHLYVVGATSDVADGDVAVRHPRLHFVGAVDDPSPYFAAADVYLESFPFGSNTALLEAARAGLPVVPAYAPLFPLLVAANDSLGDLLLNPVDETEYRTRALALVDDPAARRALGETLRERVVSAHEGSGWTRHLAGVYAAAEGLPHRPRPIPSTACEPTKGDAGLCLRNVYADGRTNRSTRAPLTAADARRHHVFVSRHIGDFVTARRVAVRVLLQEPGRASAWRLFAVALLGGAAPGLLAGWRRLARWPASSRQARDQRLACRREGG